MKLLLKRTLGLNVLLTRLEIIAQCVLFRIASLRIIQEVDKRAKNLWETARKLAPGKPTDELRHALQNYKTGVRKLYDQTKKFATDIIDKTDYRFDIEGLNIMTALAKAELYTYEESLAPTLKNMQMRFLNTPDERTFSDLLRLKRDLKRVKNEAVDIGPQEILKEGIKVVDNEIERAAKTHMTPEQATTWLKANKEYVDMEQLEENFLYKAITDDDATVESISEEIVQAGLTLESDFKELMDKLPESLQHRLESVVVETLTKRNTLGDDTVLQAIDFPKLTNKLAEYAPTYVFRSPAVKQYIMMVNEFAEVFRKDGLWIISIQDRKCLEMIVIEMMSTDDPSSASKRCKDLLKTDIGLRYKYI